MAENKQILIAGATGGVGQQIVHKFRERSAELRLLVRNIKKARKLFGKEIELVRGDIRQPDTLTPALQDIQSVICATGANMPVGSNKPKHVDYEGVHNLVAAAKDSGVERFLLVSSIAVTKPEHPLNKFGKVLDWKLKGENALRQSGLDYTIVRPGGLTNTAGGSSSFTIDQGDRISGMISRADVAEVCLQALKHPSTRNTTFEIISSSGDPIQDWYSFFSPLEPDLL